MYFPEPDKAVKDGMELSVFDKVAGEFRLSDREDRAARDNVI